MYLINNERYFVLGFLPPGLVCAEIGVARGDFSEGIRKITAPKKLHLIDPWQRVEKQDYLADGNNTDDTEGEARFAYVTDKFSAYTASGQMVIHRALSHEVVEQFDDEYFDWIYVDGDHTYKGCLTDLELFDRKVKRDGLILGHDYTNHQFGQALNFGVVEAVNEFVGTRNYHLLALTMEHFPTFVVAKSLQSPLAQEFTRRLTESAAIFVEIRDAEIRNFRHRITQDPLQRTVMSFG